MQGPRDLLRYIPALMRAGWLLTLAALVFGSGTYLISSQQTPVYQASTTISIQEAPGASITASAELQSIMLSEQRIQTYTQLLTARPLLEVTTKQLGLPRTLDKSAVTVTAIRDTQLIRVSVKDTDPVRAAQTANTLVKLFATQRQEIQASRYAVSKNNIQQQLTALDDQFEQASEKIARLGGDASAESERERLQRSLTRYEQSYDNLQQSLEQVRLAEAATASNVVQEEAAIVPDAPISPRTNRNMVLAAMAGFLVAAALVVLRENLDDRVKDPELLIKLIGIPVLGVIARSPRGADIGNPIVIAAPRSPLSEAYRALRSNIDFASVDKPISTLVITSPSPSEGKSTIVVNLGAVLAQGQRRVVVVDADLRRPTIHKRFNMTNRAGLSELFVQAESRTLESFRSTDIDTLSVVTAGQLPPNPAELLGSHRMLDIFAQLRQHADMVVIDTPPVNVVTDAAVLAPRADAVLLVVRAGSTRLGTALLAVQQLRRAGANLIGVVVNDVPVGRSGYGYASQKYYRYYGADAENTWRDRLNKKLRRKGKQPPDVTEKV